MTALSPPSRRRTGVSQYGLCVYAGCGNRAERLTRLSVGGRDREVPVCSRHGEKPAADQAFGAGTARPSAECWASWRSRSASAVGPRA